jgi:hypothetical protein
MAQDTREVLDPADRVLLPEHVVHRAFVNETVVLNLQTGKFHGLNPTGGRMLETLERSPSVREAAAVLALAYRRPLREVERDLCAFCLDLIERGLVEVVGADH